jgi:hypothetical protein
VNLSNTQVERDIYEYFRLRIREAHARKDHGTKKWLFALFMEINEQVFKRWRQPMKEVERPQVEEKLSDNELTDLQISVDQILDTDEKLPSHVRGVLCAMSDLISEVRDLRESVLAHRLSLQRSQQSH